MRGRLQLTARGASILKSSVLPNGLRYPLVGGTRQRHFDGTGFQPRKLPENAASPTSRVHAVLGAFYTIRVFQLWTLPGTTPILERTSRTVCSIVHAPESKTIQPSFGIGSRRL